MFFTQLQSLLNLSDLFINKPVIGFLYIAIYLFIVLTLAKIEDRMDKLTIFEVCKVRLNSGPLA